MTPPETGHSVRRFASPPLSNLITLGIILTVAWHPLQVGFLSDDFTLIGSVAREGLFASWGGFLRPVTVFTYGVDWALWHLWPTGFHLTNLLFHFANAALIYRIAKRFLGESAAGTTAPGVGLDLPGTAEPRRVRVVDFRANRSARHLLRASRDRHSAGHLVGLILRTSLRLRPLFCTFAAVEGMHSSAPGRLVVRCQPLLRQSEQASAQS